MGTTERKQREFAAREDALKQAAIELFERDDWETVTIDQIAARGEYAKGTVYKHFASKNDLYARLAVHYAEETLRHLGAVPKELPFEEAVRRIVAVYWDRFTARRAYGRLSLYVQRDDFLPSLPETTRERMRAVDAQHLGLVAAVLQKAIEAGDVPAGEIRMRLFAANAMLMGALRMQALWAAPGEPTDAYRDATAGAILAIFRSGAV